MSCNSTESEPLEPSQSVRIVITVIFGSILLTGVVGNVLVITVILLVKTMRSAVNLCLASLALTDLVVLVFPPIKSIVNLHGIYEPLFGTNLCVYVRSVDNSAISCSALTFLLIGVERYTVVCHPLKTRGFWTRTKVCLGLAGIWTLGAGNMVPFSIVAGYEWGKATSLNCNVGGVVPWVATYETVLMCVYFFLPIPFLLFLYGKIIITLKTQVPENDGQGNGARKIRRSRSKVIKAIVVIVVIFIVCLFPIHVLYLVDFFIRDTLRCLGPEASFTLVWCSDILFYINFIANPIVYFAMSGNFRQAFISLCCRCGKIPEAFHRSKTKTRRGNEVLENTCTKL